MAMKNDGGERRAMRRLASELVMCSTCSGIVFKFERTAVPNPQEEVVVDVTEAEKMRDLMKAVLLHGPLQKMEPAGATKQHRQVLRTRRRIMMETKRCPTCSGSPIEACPASLSEECLEFMSQGGEETKKIATTEHEAMVADARSEHRLKRSTEEGKRSGSRLKEKRMEGSGSKKKKKKAKRSSEMESNGSRAAKMKGSGLDKDVAVDMKTKMDITRMLNKKALESLNEPPVKLQLKEEAKTEGSELAVRNRKTKMVTKRLDKKSIDFLVENRPLRKPIHSPPLADFINASYELNCVFRDYLQCHSFIKGYAEYQVEVSDDEGDDHKLV